MAHGGKRTGAGRPKGIKIGTKAERLAASLGKGQTAPVLLPPCAIILILLC